MYTYVRVCPSFMISDIWPNVTHGQNAVVQPVTIVYFVEEIFIALKLTMIKEI